MRRLYGALCTMAFVLAAQTTLPAQSLSVSERQETAGFAAIRQDPSGGFSTEAGESPNLGTTTASIRILRYTGSSVPDVLSCIDFVRSCFDPESGGFSQIPGGEPDVGTTASGLMALGELRISDPGLIDPAIAYVSDHAETFPEVRIAVAGTEAVGRESPKFGAWSAAILENRNESGTWGSGPALTFDTGGTAAALLRMGLDFDRKETVTEAIRAGQRDDGGWSPGEGESDLSATYRVMRAAYMLGFAPDLDALRRFVGRCRREDGGYAPAPGVTEPTIGATYMATILLRWADLLEGLLPLVEDAGFRPLFNGRDLSGWEGDSSLWSVEDGTLVGTSPGLDHNEFLATEERFSDFVLKASFLLFDGQGNSGIQFRSDRLPGTEMIGFQADIGESYWGCLYDESRRNRVLLPATERARNSIRPDGWNQYEIRAMGDEIRLTLNGVPSVDYTEAEANIADAGRIAVQLHSGRPMEIRFRDLLIQPLPRPTTGADPNEPGFHSRTLDGSDPAVRYSVFIPEGYDGQTHFPVVLFLHGSGERGEDGILPSQVGLGPIIAAEPSAHPYIAVFPQARETWAAESDDAHQALAILDEILEDFAVDTSRIVLTGLSMGGMGTWSIGAAHSDRFSAIVPICGPGNAEFAGQFRTIPVWGFVGDQDRGTLLDGMRATVRSLKELGAPVKYTEYRGVGHNSWDRAYSEPGLVEWMLSPHRIAD
ncbi:family 16 glycoside hydrolase [Tautonia plasticadhaerens]|uniref:Prenyltransferase and squalene oxidase repeat protein n=1 Tax=Tautonia plasticadhaerens TaxID=2527974 RepID=A0A518H8Y2_9BACT|nr:family 16 glycoside hydrolase [Tautonia plasticadhaerens]QDV37308.1 Prenyltransferase and squalene oxidase repeat protein [Tautonia plasticadhaerens]